MNGPRHLDIHVKKVNQIRANIRYRIKVWFVLVVLAVSFRC